MSFYEKKAAFSNRASSRYLSINDCGIQNTKQSLTVHHPRGRKDYHILYITGGKCECLYNGTRFSLTAGDFLLYEPYEAQWYTFEGDASSFYIHFTGGAVSEILKEEKLEGGVYFLAPERRVIKAFSDLVALTYRKKSSTASCALFLSLIASLSEAVAELKSDSKNTITAVCEWMHANFSADISLSTLARKSGYSIGRFSHLFSENVGISPMKYLARIRLSIAAERLLTTDLCISDIALLCGFRDPLYFSRIFKKEYGISPEGYRKNDKQKGT